MKLNAKQILAITLVILGVLTASTAQLTDLFGPQNAKVIGTIAGMLTSLLSGISAVLSTQTSLVQDVQAMPGVEKIVVNSKVNEALANMAVDPLQQKIEAKPGSEAAINATATKG